ncbi:hypothetical protein CR513_17354, partial [Mucuna pruriens]
RKTTVKTHIITVQWFSDLPSRTIHTFNDLATCFVSQFSTNKAKKLEVADLFDIKQMKGETLKKYLVRFHGTMVQEFQKGLCVVQFNDSLALRRPASMEEARA